MSASAVQITDAGVTETNIRLAGSGIRRRMKMPTGCDGATATSTHYQYLSSPNTNYRQFKTALAHGFNANDIIWVDGFGTTTGLNGAFQVASTPTTTSFTGYHVPTACAVTGATEVSNTNGTFIRLNFSRIRVGIRCAVPATAQQTIGEFGLGIASGSYPFNSASCQFFTGAYLSGGAAGYSSAYDTDRAVLNSGTTGRNHIWVCKNGGTKLEHKMDTANNLQWTDGTSTIGGATSRLRFSATLALPFAIFYEYAMDWSGSNYNCLQTITNFMAPRGQSGGITAAMFSALLRYQAQTHYNYNNTSYVRTEGASLYAGNNWGNSVTLGESLKFNSTRGIPEYFECFWNTPSAPMDVYDIGYAIIQ